MKSDLYAMKTNQGYGFFQKWETKDQTTILNFFIIYRLQLKDLKQIKSIFKGDYYFESIAIRDRNKCNLMKYNIGNNEIIYLGKYEIPKDISLPKYSRLVSSNNVFSLRFKWLLIDLTGVEYYVTYNGQKDGYERNDGSLYYKNLVPEIIDYPVYGLFTLKELREQFDTNYHPRDYNDEYVIAQRKKARAEMTQEDKKAFKDEWKDKRDDF